MFRSTNVPFDECSIRRMFHSTNVPFDECSVRQMFRSTNVPFDECSVRQMFRSTNVPFDQCSIRPMFLRRKCRIPYLSIDVFFNYLYYCKCKNKCGKLFLKYCGVLLINYYDKIKLAIIGLKIN